MEGSGTEVEDKEVMYCLNRHEMILLSEKSEFHWYCPQCRTRSNGEDYRSDSDEEDTNVVLKDVQRRASRLEDSLSLVQSEKEVIKIEVDEVNNYKSKLEEEKAEIARLHKMEQEQHGQTKAEKEKIAKELEGHKKEVDRLQREMDQHVTLKQAYEDSQNTIRNMEKQFKLDIQAAKEGRSKEISMLKEAAAKGDIAVREKEAAITEKENALKERDAAKAGMVEANEALIE